MSGTLEEDRAGLYVLGALNAEEMRAVRTDADRDPALAGEIAAWERRLFPLVALVPPAVLPDTIWPQLDARLTRIASGVVPVSEVYQPPLRQKTRRRSDNRAVAYWRATALAGLAIAAGLGFLLVTRQPEPPPALAMIMPAQPGLGGWLISVRANGEIHATAQGALSHTLGQDFELWALPKGAAAPVPLGLLPVTNAAVLKPSALPHTQFQLLVSLEPKGGSPTGLPTGPVQFASQQISR